MFVAVTAGGIRPARQPVLRRAPAGAGRADGRRAQHGQPLAARRGTRPRGDRLRRLGARRLPAPRGGEAGPRAGARADARRKASTTARTTSTSPSRACRCSTRRRASTCASARRRTSAAPGSTTYVAKHYHKPSDEYDPGWDVSGTLQDLAVYYDVGLAVANSSDWPNWREGNEFRAIREQEPGRGKALTALSPSRRTPHHRHRTAQPRWHSFHDRDGDLPVQPLPQADERGARQGRLELNEPRPGNGPTPASAALLAGARPAAKR